MPACGLRHGIYAVRVGVGGRRYDGVASFGRRPMFDTGAVLLEVFLFDFAGDLYGASIDVAFIAWIREEANFASVDDLVRQMQDDARGAREASGARGRRVSADLASCGSSSSALLIAVSRAHCAAMKPSSATGTMRCQPSARPACTATPRIFGSSSHDGACAARRARGWRARARGGAISAQTIAAIRAIRTKMPAMIRPAKTLPNCTASQS